MGNSHPMARPIRAALPLAAAVVLVLGCGGGDSAGDAERFCGEVQANTRAIVRPRLRTVEDIDTLLALYRELGELAPLAIDADWEALILNYETASTVAPTDPGSVQRVAARAYATERSAVAVHDWLLANCAVDIGPVATIVPDRTPRRPTPTTTTLGG
jgi:hypothetical protein